MKHLKAIRKQKGFASAKSLADAVGVSAMSIYRYERGERCPDIETAFKIASALKVSIEALFGAKKVR